MDLATINERIDEYGSRFEVEVRHREMLALEHGLRLLESVGDYIDPSWRFTEDGYNSTSPWVTERRDGGNEPNFRTEDELRRIRANARMIADSNSYAVGIIENLLNYVLATGFTYEIRPKRGVAEHVPNTQWLSRVIETFQDENDWISWEEELLKRRSVDGEWLMRLFYQGGVHVQARIVEPDALIEANHEFVPFEGVDNMSWSYGIATPKNDTQRVLAYNVRYAETGEHETVLSDEVIHSKANVYRNVKRGMSDFFPVDADLSGARKLMRNMRDGAALQAAIAWIEQFPEGTRKQTVEAINSGKVDFQTVIDAATGKKRELPTRKYEGGTVLQVPKGKEYLSGPLGAERAQHFILILQGALRGIGVRWNMPEFMVSSDASNANYSSTMVAESPFVRTVLRRQAITKRDYSRIMWRVIELACEIGNIPYDVAHRDYDLVVTEISPETRDRQKETDRNQTLHNAGVLSKKTWSGREDLDHDEEQQQLQTEGPTTQGNVERALNSALNGEPVATASRRD